MTPALRFDPQRLQETLYDHEGYRQYVYSDRDGKPARDAKGGHLTIGIGRNLETRGITKEEAYYLLSNDICDCVDDLDDHLPWWRTLDGVRQEVLINMCFNMGIGSRSPARGLLSFRNTLRYIEAGSYDLAADGMLQSRWATQVGNRAEELAEMMRTGKAS